MKSSFLLPHWCKIVGAILAAPLIFACLVFLFHSGGGSLGTMSDFINENSGVGIATLSAALLMIAFSRERDEDEYVAAVRGRCLMSAFWVDFVFLVVTAFSVFDLDFIYVMAVQMFLILFLHIVMFNAAMAVIRGRRGHEE